MNRYRVLKTLGDGSFGTVLEAQNTETNERVRRLTAFNSRTSPRDE